MAYPTSPRSNGPFGSTTSPDLPYPTNSDQLSSHGSLHRKGSLNFLRRSKSRERSASIGSGAAHRKLSKKERSKILDQQPNIPQNPPTIPLVPRQPELQTFGGEESGAVLSDRSAGSLKQRLAQKASQGKFGSGGWGMSIPPVPPIPHIPGHTPVHSPISKGSFVDAFSRSESITNRGRYSYAGSAISTINSGRKIRRRKDPTPFNILVLGARSSGKTSFLNFLQSSLAQRTLTPHQHREDEYNHLASTTAKAFPTFKPHYVETEIGKERVGATLWDSEGLEANVVDLQLKEITSFIESKFEDTYTEESRVARAPGFLDTHIHCVFLVLDPLRLDGNITAGQQASMINGAKAKANSFVKSHPERIRNALDENLDLNVLRALKGKTEVVPVISKADTITTAHMAQLKRAVWDALKEHGLETIEALSQDDESISDDSTELANTDLNERDEDSVRTKEEHKAEEDAFSMTSHLDSASDSSESFSASNFDLAKPGKPTHAHEASGMKAPTSAPPLAMLPLSIISPDPCEPDVVGRKFPWGFADPYNVEHCDFMKLKELVFMEWRVELTDASREQWYEGWRTSRLNRKSRRHGTMNLGRNEVMKGPWPDL